MIVLHCLKCRHLFFHEFTWEVLCDYCLLGQQPPAEEYDDTERCIKRGED